MSAVKREVHIAPSILSADFSRLGEELQAIEKAGAGLVHIDVMDGLFVPNITIGPLIVSAAKRSTTLPLDVHLMIEAPDRYIPDFIKAGANSISVHQEACPHLHRTIQLIKTSGENVKAGVALNPSTPVSTLQHVIGDLDFVLIMSVNPGFGGQSFIPETFRKLAQLRELCRSVGRDDIDIEVDGGVTVKNGTSLIEAGVTWLVAGTAVFKADDYASAISGIKTGI